MFKFKIKKRGAALYIVLATILVVVALGEAILSLILSHGRFTHYQLTRIQAHYAAMAGINYALEQLRTGTWVVGTSCTTSSPCTMSFDAGDFKPASIVNNQISIVIRQPQSTDPAQPCYTPPNNANCVSATVTYTHQP